MPRVSICLPVYNGAAFVEEALASIAAQTIPMTKHFDSLLDRVRTESYMLLCHDDFLASPDALQQAQDVLDRRRMFRPSIAT